MKIDKSLYQRRGGFFRALEEMDPSADYRGTDLEKLTAFERQLDGLFGDQALDISTDITVLENMMAREGLSDDPIHRTQSEQTDSDDKSSGGIQLEL